MKTVLFGIRASIVGLCLAFGACGGGAGDEATNTAPAPLPSGIGAAGGTVTGPAGAQVQIPAGALSASVAIVVEQTAAGAPPLPAGLITVGAMFAFTPHGTTFAAPVTITMPFDPGAVPAGATPALYKTNAQNQWEVVPGATFGSATVTAQISSFSFTQVVAPETPAVERRDPYRIFTFINKGIGTIPAGSETGPQPHDFGGELHEIRSFSTNGFFAFDGDDTTTLEVFSSADGTTYWASAEDTGIAQLRQSQKFIKRAENATLRFVITRGLLEAIDHNQAPTLSACPRGLEIAVCRPLTAAIQFEAEARTPLGELLPDRNGEPALDVGSSLVMAGRTGLWEFSFDRAPNHLRNAWTEANFDVTRALDGPAFGDTHPQAQLTAPIIFDVDLSRLQVGGDFRVISTVVAAAFDGRGGEAAIGAFVRDPVRTGGAVMEFTGLEPADDGSPAPLVEPPAEPCAVPRSDAGSLQFSAPSYSVLEALLAAGNGVVVTRAGGSSGTVSALVTVGGGGTAVPGTDYIPKTTRIRFADGDTEPLLVPVEILSNEETEADRTVAVTLSDPGGCATLGAQSSAVLTILDDDQPPPPPAPSGLDPTFGEGGKATLPAFGGDRSAMALQPDGKIVMVGGTPTDFILARFNADGSIDASFDTDGRVTTDMVSGTQEEALGVAIQRDGKIVVVGYTGSGGARFALARYNADGSLDGSFGSAGKIVSGVVGIAYAIAIQPDDKIVVAGEVPRTGSSNASDFVVARYHANGTLDTSFSGDGSVTTDIGGATNAARNIVLQPNGAIVVSGEPVGTFTGSDHTDIVRYDGNGNLDSSFGSAGVLTLSGARVGEGLTLQSDGKLVLVGNVAVGTSPTVSTQFAVTRLDADGSPDGSFGTGGTVSTPITTLGDSALAVAIQGDGKILVAGKSSGETNSNFALARYNDDGTLDENFADTGKLAIDFFGFRDQAESVVVQTDGKMVIGGLARDSVDGYGVARVLP